MSRLRHYCYRITHDATGRYYLGVHFGELDDDYLGSGDVIRALVNKYGPAAFTKVVLSKHRSRETAERAEARLITRKRLADPLCVNVALGGFGGPMLGREHDDATKARLAELAANMPQEQRDKIAATLKGNTNASGERTPEQRARMSKSAKRKKPPTAAARRAKSEGMKKAWAEGRRSRTMTDAAKARMSKSAKRRWEDPEERARMSDLKRGNTNASGKRSAAAKARMSKSAKVRAARPEGRAHLSAIGKVGGMARHKGGRKRA